MYALIVFICADESAHFRAEDMNDYVEEFFDLKFRRSADACSTSGARVYLYETRASAKAAEEHLYRVLHLMLHEMIEKEDWPAMNNYENITEIEERFVRKGWDCEAIFKRYRDSPCFACEGVLIATIIQELEKDARKKDIGFIFDVREDSVEDGFAPFVLQDSVCNTADFVRTTMKEWFAEKTSTEETLEKRQSMDLEELAEDCDDFTFLLLPAPEQDKKGKKPKL
jgi:hypothetical protein